MSVTTLLTETSRQDLDAVNPKLAQQFEQLVDLLRRRLSAAHAQLFAEPVPVAVSGSGRSGLAWFAALDGEAQPVTRLEAAEAEALRRTAARLTAEIAIFADGLEREGEASRELARLLRDALVVPDADHLWSVDGQPVLVGWGYRRTGSDGPAPVRAGAITASIAASAGKPAPAASASSVVERIVPPSSEVLAEPAPDRRRDWFGPTLWLLVALLCGILADRLLHACALGDGTWPTWIRSAFPNRCPLPSVAVDPVTAAILADIRAVDGEVRAAELGLTRRALSCPVDLPSPPPPLPRRAEVEAPPVVRAPEAIPAPRAIPAEVERRLAGIERGRGLELTLAWDGASDLDLQVVCPDRTRINFDRRAACGGRLVADQNSNGGTSASRSIEHVIWDEVPAPDGHYVVEVSLYARHGEGRPSIPFQVVLSRAGQVLDQRTGQVSAQRTGQTALTFDAPSPATAGSATVP